MNGLIFNLTKKETIIKHYQFILVINLNFLFYQLLNIRLLFII